MKYLVVVSFLFSISLFSQKKPNNFSKDRSLEGKANKVQALKKDTRKKQDTINLTIQDYLIISFERDTTFLDTTLTINKEYRYNYLRQDNFELMSFSNIGQAYNSLAFSFDRENMYPALGAAAKDRRYYEKEEIKYYNVPTPMTELFFKTTLEQGQLLDANLTFNTSKRLNFSLGYTGHRSLGKYNSDQVLSGNFITTSNYLSKNGRYALRAHIAAQNITSQENAGLTDEGLQFESGSPDFINRPRVDVRFDNMDNKVLGKRYYLDQTYKLLRKQLDTTNFEKTSLSIGHSFNYETKYYQFLHTTSDLYFGESILDAVNDKAYLKTFNHEGKIQFYNKSLGKLSGLVKLYNYNYYFDSRFIESNGQVIESNLQGTEFAMGGQYQKKLKGFNFNASMYVNLSGELSGNLLDASASYTFKNGDFLNFSLHSSQQMPNFNFLLYQSEYLNFNWQNTSNFKKETVSRFGAQLHTNKWGMLNADISRLDKYTYFSGFPQLIVEDGFENGTIKPYQEDASIFYVKVKYQKEFRLGKFALNNTLMYQSVNQNNQVLNVPELITRNTFYFSSDVFKKAMYLQTGVTLKYFTSYYMNAYSPLLGEFYVQNREKFGGFPMIDIFANAKIKQTRVYLKLEHFNSSFTGYNFYAAPRHPYRDAVIRFGLVWNFFS